MRRMVVNNIDNSRATQGPTPIGEQNLGRINNSPIQPWRKHPFGVYWNSRPRTCETRTNTGKDKTRQDKVEVHTKSIMIVVTIVVADPCLGLLQTVVAAIVLLLVCLSACLFVCHTHCQLGRWPDESNNSAESRCAPARLHPTAESSR